MMNEESITELTEIATSDNFIDSTLAIIKNQTEIRKQIIKNFILQMKEIAKTYKYEITIEDETDLCRLKDNTWIDFYCPKISQEWGFSIGAYEHIKGRDGGVRYGITQLLNSKCRIKNEQLAAFHPVWPYPNSDKKDWSFQERKDWPFGWAYLNDPDNRCCWWNWKDDWNTLHDMATHKISNWFEKEFFAKDLPRKLIRKIERYTNR